ncbi:MULTISPECIES: siroheme decarboxylase subunit beta [Bradyrhizobium]|uniref:siroheme decarboxylase subunit beta n=1 Tax=Bradyrhizobium TaxID=374 RepID=UPI001BA4CE38|nr:MULTISPECIES: AsnC family transcriptional regulator [Bradyrhizobium]MBR0927889.1 AsnC family transcriptional regulator [Bradyrhizobium diazoefficiens]MCS3760475.1 DNA-binding Lrp family transcriptional regulator [Bradyrhizobium centrosematis]MCS3771638.1 DNA-binding Lrp family transcriptional regulator [Bradyrhizobium centrosematis]MDT4742661.1 AsnC family transcriptional regulator [Bradyrhizobium sp. WYCCWR 12699]
MLDAIDRKLIAATQAGLPLVAEPYRALADELGLDEAEIVRRLARLLDDGAIRRIGAIPNHYALGTTANGMSVWDIADEAVADVGARVGALDFVTHCYERPRHLPLWPYNLFAMVHGRTRDEVRAKVAEIAVLVGSAARAHEVLFSTRILKKTGLRIAA